MSPKVGSERLTRSFGIRRLARHAGIGSDVGVGEVIGLCVRKGLVMMLVVRTYKLHVHEAYRWWCAIIEGKPVGKVPRGMPGTALKEGNGYSALGACTPRGRTVFAVTGPIKARTKQVVSPNCATRRSSSCQRETRKDISHEALVTNCTRTFLPTEL